MTLLWQRPHRRRHERAGCFRNEGGGGRGGRAEGGQAQQAPGLRRGEGGRASSWVQGGAVWHRGCGRCAQTHKRLVEGVVELARRVQADKELTALIRRKFAIKCTTGASVSAARRG